LIGTAVRILYQAAVYRPADVGLRNPPPILGLVGAASEARSTPLHGLARLTRAAALRSENDAFVDKTPRVPLPTRQTPRAGQERLSPAGGLYEGIIKARLLPVFGGKAVSAITVTDCEQFHANLLATRRPRTVRNVWQMLDRVLEYAYEHKAIVAVPTAIIDRSAAQ
jgi:hypothetical protein